MKVLKGKLVTRFPFRLGRMTGIRICKFLGGGEFVPAAEVAAVKPLQEERGRPGAAGAAMLGCVVAGPLGALVGLGLMGSKVTVVDVAVRLRDGRAVSLRLPPNEVKLLAHWLV